MMSPLILLQLGFVQSDRYSSIYIPADGQLDQHHLLKLFFCFSIVLFLLLCKNKTKQKQKKKPKKNQKNKKTNKQKNQKQMSVGMWVYFWILYSIPF
jgi:nicotinamide riboside transporter PnuC